METPTINKSELIAIRDYLPGDMNLILATWLRGLYYSDSWYSEIPKNIFMDQYHKIIKTILASPHTSVRVACLKEDPEVILGYAVLSNVHTAVHWVFCKKNWRGIGIAKDLVPNTVNSATHATKVGLGIMKKKGYIFNPFLI